MSRQKGRTPPAAPRRTRRAILDALEGAPDGMTAARLAATLGVHANAVRKQLRALAGEGAVSAAPEPAHGRGRPAMRYRAAPAGREAAATRRLARMLVELVGEIGADEDRVEDFGRRQAVRLASGAADGASVLHVLAALGFGPEQVAAPAGGGPDDVEVVLRHCPFRDAVEAAGGRLVCVLHRGISRGLVELTPGARMTAFEARPPRTAGCRIAARGLGRPPALAG